MRLIYIKSIFCLAVAIMLAGCSKTNAPDTVFYNGVVVTVDDVDSIYAAVAVKDGKISLLGSTDEVLSLAGDSTVKVDLDGDTLIPGFVGVHEHPTLEAILVNKAKGSSCLINKTLYWGNCNDFI